MQKGRRRALSRLARDADGPRAGSTATSARQTAGALLARWVFPARAAEREKPASAAASRVPAVRWPAGSWNERTYNCKRRWSAGRRFGSMMAVGTARACGHRRGGPMCLRAQPRTLAAPLSCWLARRKPPARKPCAARSVRWLPHPAGSSAARGGTASSLREATAGASETRRPWTQQPGDGGQTSLGAPNALRQPAAAQRARLRDRCALAARARAFGFSALRTIQRLRPVAPCAAAALTGSAHQAHRQRRSSRAQLAAAAVAPGGPAPRR